jgi:hypothetical protein
VVDMVFTLFRVMCGGGVPAPRGRLEDEGAGAGWQGGRARVGEGGGPEGREPPK